MLKVISMTLLIIPTAWFSSMRWLWTLVIAQSIVASVYSFTWLHSTWATGWRLTSIYTGVDSVSAPLLVLTTWLLPLMILASRWHMFPSPETHQRMYITLMVLLQAMLLAAFGASELLMFYVMFEATLIPTLFIITRWGNQEERLFAGNYFLFYTLLGSLPLLVSLIGVHVDLGTMSLVAPQKYITLQQDLLWVKAWWVACLFAFLVKLPLYGFHLWLPKAHVEAPVAGSMILAAVLLKLGAYGIMRMMPKLEPMTNDLNYPFITLALWGVVMTGSTCMRQPDVKSMIAYSSVSHMGLLAAALLIQTTWGNTGAMIMMITHGLTSSLLFAMANTNYERTHTRTMLLARGLQMLLPLMGAWWFFACLVNLGLPPFPSYMAELVMFVALYKWSDFTLIMTGWGALITVAYSLFLFLLTQRGPIPKHIINMPPTYTREHLLVILHVLPLLLLVAKPHLIMGWSI
uniref:NADH dehydrogenase subunit 4 n=1 Tax=Pseudanthias huchtii TaxID=586854 RepID=UPI0023D866A7|nr:NADH dehydrogenase subunit 4 [Pseudanthias huchtii]WCR63087.1 NADH dehydrogenase subunit 4 [Pseudanthias huchtii]